MTAVARHQHLVTITVHSAILAIVHLVFYVRFQKHVTILHILVHQILQRVSLTHVVHHKPYVCQFYQQLSAKEVLMHFTQILSLVRNQLEYSFSISVIQDDQEGIQQMKTLVSEQLRQVAATIFHCCKPEQSPLFSH